MQPKFPPETEEEEKEQKVWKIDMPTVLVGIILVGLAIAIVLVMADNRRIAQTELQPTVAPTCAPCEPLPTGGVGPLDVDDAEYRFVAIGNMPCLLVPLDYGNKAVLGFTCDWSRWEGNQDE